MPVQKKPAEKPAAKPAAKPSLSQAALKAKVDECHVCCKKLESEIADLKIQLNALKSQKPQESEKDERLDSLLKLLGQVGSLEVRRALRNLKL